jgi:hypothetical protein
MGCGYEQPLVNAPVNPWNGTQLGRELTSDERDAHGRELEPVCAGYACGLPEVIEASHAYVFLKNGGLMQATDGEPPSASLREAVTIIECESSRVMEWSAKNPEKT